MVVRRGSRRSGRNSERAPFERLVDALADHGCQPDGAGRALCPAHNDQRASLVFNEGNQVAVVFHCFAGCTPDEILNELDLSWTDIGGGWDLGDEGRLEELGCTIYDYQDEDERTVFQVVRRGDGRSKEFFARRPAPPDDPRLFICDVQGVDRPLYRLPEVFAGIEDFKTIYFVEGEKDVETAVRNGLVATTNAFGGKLTASQANSLDGARVVVVGDNDDRGRQRALDVYERLLPVSKSVVITFPKVDNDLTDMFDAGGTVDDLEEAAPDEVRQLLAKPWQPLTFAEVCARPDEVEWTVKNVLPKSTYGMIAGPAKSLKTHLAMALGVSVASGRPFLGEFEVTNPGPVLFFVGEGSRRGLTSLAKRMAEAIGVRESEVDMEFIERSAALDSDDFQTALRYRLGRRDYAAVLVDPYYAYHRSGANSASLHDEGALLNSASSVCMEFDSTLLIVNHFNQTGRDKSLSRITGAGGAEWCDSWILVDHRFTPEPDEGRFYLTINAASRQAGARKIEVDFSLGKLDSESGEFNGGISWDLDVEQRVRRNVREDILTVVGDQPFELTKEQIKRKVGGSSPNTLQAFNKLATDGMITSRKTKRDESGHERTRPTWGLAEAEDVEVA